jgi:hypothetical protein
MKEKPSPPDTTDLVDQALDYCRNIHAVAGLLRVAAGPRGGDPLGGHSVHGAAALIEEQSDRLRELIHRLQNGQKKPTPRR